MLAGKLRGMLLLLPHYRTNIHTLSKYTLTTNWLNVCTGGLFYKPVSGDCGLGQVMYQGVLRLHIFCFSLCPNYASLIDYLSEDPFRLRRTLEKLTSLPPHIETLFGFAHSTSLLPALRYGLFICAVPGKTHTVQLPASAEEWTSLLRVECFKRYGFR